MRREGTFLWYSANTEALQELLGFLYAECCTRNKAIEPQSDCLLLRKDKTMSTQNVKEVVKEKYGQAALRVQSGAGNSCCGRAASALEASCDPITSNLYDACTGGEVPETAHESLSGLRQSDGARRTKARRNRARSRLRRRH